MSARASSWRVALLSSVQFDTMQGVQTQLLTTPQVAVALGVSTRTVYRLATAGRLVPALKLPGPNGALLFDPADVEAFRASKVSA